jgi:hypothetical protein
MERKASFAQLEPDDMPSDTHLRINGLTAVPGEPGLFKLSGVRPRIVDHEALARALSAEHDPELVDKALQAVWKFDMVRVLTERIVI